MVWGLLSFDKLWDRKQKKGGAHRLPICSQVVDCPRYFTAEFVKT